MDKTLLAISNDLEMEEILEAAAGTLALARDRGMEHCDIGHAPCEYAHLAGMVERMRAPGFHICKANRWLGYIQGVVMVYSTGNEEGPIPLDVLKGLNRPD